jgi:hypothetical protein
MTQGLITYPASLQTHNLVWMSAKLGLIIIAFSVVYAVFAVFLAFCGSEEPNPEYTGQPDQQKTVWQVRAAVWYTVLRYGLLQSKACALHCSTM